jgi:hypothetical protein
MVTCLPGDVLSRAWGLQVGRLTPGAVADLVVVDQRRDDPWASLVAARERDIVLVVAGGRPVWGTSAAMSAAGASNTTTVRMGSVSRRLTLVRPDDPTATWAWTDLLGRLETVRTTAKREPPSGPAAGPGRGDGRVGAADPPGTPPIVLDLDMPGGPQGVAGPPPKGQVVEIPPIEPIYHNAAWLKTIKGRGFHRGALDELPAAFA